MRRLELARAVLGSLLVCGLTAAADAAPTSELRVCADPNNLPFSDADGSGFENKLAEMLGRDLERRVTYTWWAQRRGALRNTLKAQLCDVVMGVPASLGLVATTKPYYSSSYVFVSKVSRSPEIASFDDARLRTLTIGVQLVGDDYANTPPVHALSARGISDNVRGYSVLGDYAERTPASRILRAVVESEVDVAIVWGPLAGYFAKSEHPELRLTPTPARDGELPMRFDIALGVRRGDRELRSKLDAFVARRRPAIDALLTSYGVPRP
jgi:mxaJ protein